MWQVTPKFHEAMRTSHQIVVRADLYQQGVLLAENVDVTGGSVTVDAKSQVRRTADVTVALSESLPLLRDSLFVPSGAEIALFRGVDYGYGQQEIVPVGVFRIDTTTLARPAMTLTLRCSDRTIMVQDDRFLMPQQPMAKTVKGEIRSLIGQTVPGAPVTDLTSHDLPMWPVTWETERWEAVEKLARALHAVVFFDAAGGLVIAPEVPTGDPVWSFSVGEGGTVTSMTTTLSRLDSYNAVVVVGGDPLGENPIPPQIARDEDPASPTRWGGPFGRRPKFYASQFINTEADGLATAKEMLALESGLQRRVELTAVPHPALDAGDLVTVEFPNGVVERHVIERLSFGLGADSAMTVATKSLRVVGA